MKCRQTRSLGSATTRGETGQRSQCYTQALKLESGVEPFFSFTATCCPLLIAGVRSVAAKEAVDFSASWAPTTEVSVCCDRS